MAKQVTTLLESRTDRWKSLENYCERLEKIRGARLSSEEVSAFASLYRSACADLALAESYRLNAETVKYLNSLVGRAHNQLYRSQNFNFSTLWHTVFVDLPTRLVRDKYFYTALILFWSIFLICAGLAYSSREFAESLIGQETLDAMQEMYSQSFDTLDPDERSGMIGFYIWNNAGIGLKCFALGVLFGIAGLFITTSNAATLGTVFGFMATTPQSDNFFNFVTAHGPFELTAIVIAAGAGMRLGFSMINTGKYSRIAALRLAGREILPVIMFSVTLFIMAAFIEAFVSPSPLPYVFKAGVAIISGTLLVVYIFGLGLMGVMSGSETQATGREIR